jgi:hypothetical protein
MNSIEEYQNLVNLLKTTLEFYADERNYAGYMGNPASIDLDEHGSQARFVLAKVKELEELNQKMQDDYDRITAGYEQLQASDDVADIKELMKTYKILGDDKDI